MATRVAALLLALADGAPNIIFLMADMHRFDFMGKGMYTPHLDALAADGAKFTSHYSSTPTCTPARAGLLTGRSPWGHGLLGYGDIASKYPHEMPAAMAELGYGTYVIGKNHFGWDEQKNQGVSHGFEFMQIYDGLGSGMPKRQGEFDDYDQWFQKQTPGQDLKKSGDLGWNTIGGAPYEYDEYYHPTAWTGRLAVRHVRRLATLGKPFFLKVSFHRPHGPYDPPKRLLDDTPSIEAGPARSQDGWDVPLKTCSSAGSPDAWCGQVKPGFLDLSRRAYLANVRFVDEQIGLILQASRDSEIMNNTFFIYTSDHGDMLNDHWLWRKSYAYEASSHIPLIMRWPESLTSQVQRGSQIDKVTELRDLFPTFLDVAGGWSKGSEANFDGRPLTWLLQEGTSWREWVDLEHNLHFAKENHWNALTDGKVKYIYHAYFGAEQLFNLTADPYENKDLSKEEDLSEVLKMWRSRMVSQFERERRGPMWVQDGKLMVRRKACNYGPNYPLPVKDCHIVEKPGSDSAATSVVV